MTPGVSNLALQTEIKGLGNRIEDVKKLLVGYEERIRCLERAGDSTRPVYEKRIKDLEDKTDDHAKELKELTTLVKQLSDSVKSMKTIWSWALGIFTVVITALIIMFITGNATMVFK